MQLRPVQPGAGSRAATSSGSRARISNPAPGISGSRATALREPTGIGLARVEAVAKAKKATTMRENCILTVVVVLVGLVGDEESVLDLRRDRMESDGEMEKVARA